MESGDEIHFEKFGNDESEESVESDEYDDESESGEAEAAPETDQCSQGWRESLDASMDDSKKNLRAHLSFDVTEPINVPAPNTGTGYPMQHPPPFHIPGVPDEPEPFNEIKEGIINLMIMHDEKRILKASAVLNRVVFDSIEPNPAWKEKDKLAKDKPKSPSNANSVRQYYEPVGPEDDTLIFESRFESGNLRRAIQVYVNEYDLILRPDINTRGHTQWYYFSVKNMRRGRKYKFNIINLLKPDSVYNQGLLPLIYSEREAESSGVGWHRCGSDVAYFQNGIKRKNGSYYTLTFSVCFPHDDDTAYLAHCYPYTFTDLRMYPSNCVIQF